MEIERQTQVLRGIKHEPELCRAKTNVFTKGINRIDQALICARCQI